MGRKASRSGNYSWSGRLKRASVVMYYLPPRSMVIADVIHHVSDDHVVEMTESECRDILAGL
jgi:hypothetical protein